MTAKPYSPRGRRAQSTSTSVPGASPLLPAGGHRLPAPDFRAAGQEDVVLTAGWTGGLLAARGVLRHKRGRGTRSPLLSAVTPGIAAASGSGRAS
ncbi:hypothetical protein M2271_002158 [Streptomyces sp. LBL]|nr:hypothetical protein [Streptomyces sp. LBL]